MRTSLHGFLFLLLLGPACKTRSGGDELKEAWVDLVDSKYRAVAEVSDRFEFIRTHSTLPSKGEAKPLPWNDLEKSDLTPNLNQAVASILFAEPSAVKASASQSAQSAATIKSLLVNFISERSTSEDGVETFSLGGACRMDGESYRKSLEPRASSQEAMKTLDDGQCFSVNAGAFHLATSNLLGLRNLSFVIDPEIDQEFIFSPVVKFSVEPLGLAVKTDDNHTQLQIKNSLTYLLATGELKTSIYRYVLELDESGEVVNGEWLGKAAPQVIWMQNRPAFGPSDKDLEQLYTSSVSLPVRMALQDFSSFEVDRPMTPVRDQDPLLVNHKYRIELKGDVPNGADSLKNFLNSAFRKLGNISIYRNSFADEEGTVSIVIQVHEAQSFVALKEAVRAHSNGRTEIERILR